jgi:RND family efflux transporter MFP subunit
MKSENQSTHSTQTAFDSTTRRPSSGRGIRWFLVIPVVLVILGGITFVLRSRTSKALAATTQSMDAEPVTVTHAMPGKVENQLILPSVVQAFEDSPIYARTSGYISHWYVDIGTHVKQGQLLAVIAAPEVDQELNQARAGLNQTEASLSLAQVTAQRYQDLIKTKAVAQQQVDQNNQNLDVQNAGLQAAQANVRRLEELQAFERVIAPFDGIITQRLTDTGNLINAGNSGNNAQLFRISKINVVRIFIPVPEIYSDQITDGLHATLNLLQLPGQQFPGTVTRSSHSIDPASHTLLTEIDVPNPTGKLLPGAYADVHLDLAAAKAPLTVPIGAVLFEAAGPQVALVNSSSQVELHSVGIGRDFGATIEVTGGLTTNDQIIASPPDYLVNGMRVTVQQQPAAPRSSDATNSSKN